MAIERGRAPALPFSLLRPRQPCLHGHSILFSCALPCPALPGYLESFEEYFSIPFFINIYLKVIASARVLWPVCVCVCVYCVCVSSSSCVVVFFLRPPLGLGLESCVWLALTLFTLDRCQLAALPLPLLLLLLALPCSLYCCLCAVLLLFM